jgi:agmatine deiminase
MVYFSRALREQFPIIAKTLTDRLICKELNCSNLWCRDFMPARTGDSFTKFQYKRNIQYPHLEVNPECWQFINPYMSDIYLDGGNVVQNEDVVFITEQVFKNNSNILRTDLEQFLKDIFRKKIVFLPVEPCDDLGHADGIIKFKDKKTVFINDYRSLISQTWAEYAMKLEKVITDAGFDFVKIPWAYGECPKITDITFKKQYPLADDFNPGFGYYINWYQVDNLLFLPFFNIKKDLDVIKFLRMHISSQTEIISVDCSELSMLGGLINCVIWED